MQRLDFNDSKLLLNIIIFSIFFLASSSVIFTQQSIWNHAFYIDHVSGYLSGDEPYYLVVASSLLNHQTFAVSAFFKAAEPDPNFTFPYGFYSNPSSWHPLAGTNILDEPVYTHHSIGLSLLLLPGYAVGGINGSLIVLTTAFSFLGVVIFNFCSKFTNTKSSIVTTLVIGFGTILFTFSSSLYPEIVMALFLLTCLYLFFYKKNNFLFTSIIGSLLGFSILLKPSFGIFSLFLLPLMIIILLKNNKKSIITLIGFFLLFLILSLFYNDMAFGNFTSFGSYGGIVENRLDTYSSSGERLNLLAHGLMNYLFGQSYGLFVFSPILLFSIFGFPLFWKYNKSIALTFIIVFTSFLAIHSMFHPYAAVWTMPSRYIVPILPLLAIPLCLLFERFSKNIVFNIGFFVTVLIGLIFNYILSLSLHGHLRITERVSTAQTVWLGLSDFLPYFSWAEPDTIVNAWKNTSEIFWIFLIILSALFLIFTYYSRNINKKIIGPATYFLPKTFYVIVIFSFISFSIFIYLDQTSKVSTNKNLDIQIAHEYRKIHQMEPEKEIIRNYRFDVVEEGKTMEWVLNQIKMSRVP